MPRRPQSRRQNFSLLLPRWRRARLFLERLEDRSCPSIYYDYAVMAAPGQGGLVGIEPAVSVNASGMVAFVGSQSGGQTVYAAGSAGTPFVVGFAPSSSRTYGRELEINDGGRVGAVDNVSGSRRARLWDANNPGAFTIIARSSIPPFDSSYFDGLSSQATVSNDGQLGFAGLDGTIWEIHQSATGIVEPGDIFTKATTLATPAFFRQFAADGDRLVLADNAGGIRSVTWFDLTGFDTKQVFVAGSNASVGIRPGISSDGNVVAYCADIGDGLGIYARVRDGSGAGGFSAPIRIAGADAKTKHADLGITGPATYIDGDGDGDVDLQDAVVVATPIFFNSFDLDARVGVELFQNPTGDPDLVEAGETFVISFIGTPSQASKTNTQTNQPLIFSGKQGLWTVRITAGQDRQGKGPLHYFDRTSATPVAQIDDAIGGHKVTSLAVHDPLAAATFKAGVPVHAGDHHVAFVAGTAAGNVVIRATQTDADGDGLFDHWETKGIDIDNDGKLDLNLPRMGADPMHKDAFLEIDWLAPDLAEQFTDSNLNGEWDPGEPFIDVTGDGQYTFGDYSPQIEAMQFVVDLMANAPLDNPDGTQGVRLHADGGLDLWINMGKKNVAPHPDDVQGGDWIPKLTGNHYHNLQYGPDGFWSPAPGSKDIYGRPIQYRSLESVKKDFFGTTTNNAREFVFRYCVIADKVIDGLNSGAAEITAMGAPDGNLTLPTNDFVVALASSRSWGGKLKVPTPAPGAPATIAEPIGFMMGQTIAHEMGHTLGLLHGGFNSTTTGPPGSFGHAPANYKPTYRSLMNYSYQFDPDPTGVLVRDYGGPGDPVFNDWAYVRLGFSQNFHALGNTYGLTVRGADTKAPEHVDFPFENTELRHGKAEKQPPAMGFHQPVDATLLIGESLTVQVRAIDDKGIASVVAEFDVNGNGTIEPSEQVTATLIAPEIYEATFVGVSGPFGARTLKVTATDTATFTDVELATIEVVDPATAGPTPTVSGPFTGVRGQLRTFTFTATDITPGDDAAGFEFLVNWGDGSPTQTIPRTSGNGVGVTLDHAFSSTGAFTVQVTATDQSANAGATAMQGIAIKVVDLQGTTLMAGGSAGNDRMRFDRAGAKFTASVNGLNYGPFTGVARIVAMGLAGNDFIDVRPTVTVPAELYGDEGNDYLLGGSGPNLLVGGAGADNITGGRGRDFVIGGLGNDLLRGGAGEDILVGGDYLAGKSFAEVQASGNLVLNQWSGPGTYLARTAALQGDLASRMTDDDAADTMLGGAGQDWHWGRKTGLKRDVLRDYLAMERWEGV